MTSNSQTHRNPYVGEGENGARRSAQIDPDSGVFHPEALIDWEAWAEDYDREGRGWSSTEHRLAQLVAALTVRDRTMKISGVLDLMGSWERDVWRILVEWGTGGNQRDQRGREQLAESGRRRQGSQR